MDTYKWNYYGETTQEILSEAFVPLGTSIGEVVTQAKLAAYERTIIGLTEKALEQGLTISILNVTTNAGYTERSWWERAGVRKTAYKIWVSIEAEFESDKPLMDSPVALALMIILKWIMEAIIIVLVAYFAIQAVQAWLQSMTTTTSKVTKTTTTTNPDTGEITTTTTTEETKEPSLIGMAEIMIVVIILGVVLIFSVFGVPRKQKRK